MYTFYSILIFFAYIININFKGVNKMDKTKTEKRTPQIQCSLFGSKVCPKPKECDGYNRLCSVWQRHSGR